MLDADSIGMSCQTDSGADSTRKERERKREGSGAMVGVERLRLSPR